MMRFRLFLWVLPCILIGCGTTRSKTLPSAPPRRVERPPVSRVKPAGPDWDVKLHNHLMRQEAVQKEIESEALGYVDLARAYLDMGSPDRAMKACRQALEIWPDCLEAQRLMMLLRRQR